MTLLQEVPLPELIALHQNYWLVGDLQAGERFRLTTRQQFEAIEKELQRRIITIKFTE